VFGDQIYDLYSYLRERIFDIIWALENGYWNPPPFEPFCNQFGNEYMESMRNLGIFHRDPLILDLDGDGAKAISIAAGVHFDHDADGFAEATGWACPRDGLLVLDRNGDGKINDGRELFGDQTVLKSGKKAANGFEALAEFDENKDGRIDANDAIYSKLRVWQDSDADGISKPEELHSLNDLGISAIDIASTITNQPDPRGNTQTRSGSFEKADGSTGQIAQFQLSRSTVSTIPAEWLEVPDDIAVLPDLGGMGNVHNLHQAMVRDTSGELKSLVEQFVNASNASTRNALMEQILFKWTGAESIPPSSRGVNIDARKLAVLEKFMGTPWIGPSGPNPPYANAVEVRDIYRRFSEHMYASLMTQTHLKSIWDKVFYVWDEEAQTMKPDLTLAKDQIQQDLNNNPAQGRQELSEFARTLRAFNTLDKDSYLIFRETFIMRDASLAWVFDTGGLPVRYAPANSQHWRATDDAEAIVANGSDEGDSFAYGMNGDDVMYGASREDRVGVLLHDDGDAVLVGGAWRDVIYAGSGNNIIDGGRGDDELYGERGNDTYIFRRGSGEDDRILDGDPTLGNVDTIFLGSNLAPGDIILRHEGRDLVLRIRGTTDKLTVREFFDSYFGTSYRIERILFMDGTVWTDSDIMREAYRPTEGPDTIFGGHGDDILYGLGGNDQLYGLGGNDTLNGGTASHRRGRGARGDKTEKTDFSAISADSAVNPYAFAA